MTDGSDLIKDELTLPQQ